MDPYLEDPAYWPDVHQRLITYLSDDLNTLLPAGYVARAEERVYVSTPPKFVIHDLAIGLTRAPHPGAARLAWSSGTTVIDRASLPADEPVTVLLATQVREPFIQVLDLRRGRTLETVIEILSPSNKAFGSAGWQQYRKKQTQVLGSDSHLIEIDLLRGGTHAAAIPMQSLGLPHRWDYLVSVVRASSRDRGQAYVRSLRERLPRFGVPLADADPDAVVDLQVVLDRCYDQGRYAQELDYTSDPPVPLSSTDRSWARSIVDRGPGPANAPPERGAGQGTNGSHSTDRG
jgi:hypothetical protein